MNQSSKLRISIVVSYTYPYIGSGIGNVAQQQAEALAKMGHDVTLHSSNFPATQKEFTKNGVKYLKFPAWYGLEKISVPVPLTILSLASWKELAKADVIHVHDGLYISSFLAAIWAKILDKKLVVTVHIGHVKYPNFLVDTIEKIAELLIALPVFLLADHLVLINKNLKSNLTNFKEKISIVSNGVDTTLFKPVSLTQKNKLKAKLGLKHNKIVLFVGRLVAKKGFTLVMNANDPSYELVFVGEGNVTDEMKALSNTHWLGAVTQAELAEYYQIADAMVLPSHGEGYPLCIKEAIASGVPVITTFEHPSLTPLSDTLVFKVKPDSNDIAAKIKSVLKKSRKDKKLITSFIENFNWSKSADVLVKLYEN